MRLMIVLCTRAADPYKMGPIKHRLRSAKDTLHYMPQNKSWFCGGFRSASIAAQLLRTGEIVALPTDTIYGLAGLAQSEQSIAKLYKIKERDLSKPLAICLSDINDIPNWAHTEHLPEGLIQTLLPGPLTLVLKRKSTLNPLLNPGVANVGVRVPNYDFTLSIVKMVNQPLALTSANKSNTRSSLHPDEFQDLWPKIGGIFYEKMNTNNLKSCWRRGSTVIDLSVAGEFQILRKGIGYDKAMKMCNTFKLKQRADEKQKVKVEGRSKKSETLENTEVSATA